ncbi:MAG: hypothetical protein R3E39_11405 [Anaerolineae bacterium]
MDISVLLVALVLVAFVAYIVYRKLQRDERRFAQLYRPVDESLLDQSDFDGVISFEGDSTFESQQFKLEIGRYKLMYWFPDAVLVKVELFSVDGIEHDVIALKQGEGAVEFSVTTPGKYFCMIEPAHEDSAWEIEISRLGLPSHAAGVNPAAQ